jgi:hypothetical protein
MDPFQDRVRASQQRDFGRFLSVNIKTSNTVRRAISNPVSLVVVCRRVGSTGLQTMTLPFNWTKIGERKGNRGVI